MLIAVVALTVALATVLVLLGHALVRSAALRRRFAAIVDVDVEIARSRAAAAAEAVLIRRTASEEAARFRQEGEHYRQEAKHAVSTARDEATRLRTDVARELDAAHRRIQEELAQHTKILGERARLQADLERMHHELRNIEGGLEDISFGLYRPQYRFDTPEQFKAEMERVYEQQKEMVRGGKAASFAVEWTVGNSRREGQKMQKQYTKLLLRAFNGECDAAIAKVAWNNASKMEERIKKAFAAINQLGEVMTVSLAPKYRDLKLAELHLEHELAEKKREIAEEQRRMREQMKDEQRALQEAERAQDEAEAEELRFQKALERATVELSKARGEEHNRLNERIQQLQDQLADARARSVRAKSLAEMTKAGYVYVISNVGSFGDRVFKIGMTRRLEPMDRIRELSGASVPFPFDVHAMVYSEDAPALETAFHHRFRDRSVNLVNARKEFFNVDISELEAFVRERGLAMTFTKLGEAREYRESAAMRLAKGSGPNLLPGPSAESAPMSLALSTLMKESTREPRPDSASAPSTERL
ncbi:MAG: DUF4041 domain-containing protein [Kofleriaceae bacterium]